MLCPTPPGFDDCCVHFLCFYCATHQELREAVMRGLDGPGGLWLFCMSVILSDQVAVRA